MTRDRVIALIALLLCVGFAISLVGAVFNYSRAVDQKNSEIQNLAFIIEGKNEEISILNDKVESDTRTIISLNDTTNDLQSQVDSLNNQIKDLQDLLDKSNSQITTLTVQSNNFQQQLANSNSQISSLNSTVVTLQEKVDEFIMIIAAMNASSGPKTLVFHVAEKGEGYDWGRLPDANYTYEQILDLNNESYDVLLLPEFEGNSNWTETLAWLAQNFSKIPIMLSVFEGGSLTEPNLQLSTSQISDAMTSCDVEAIRIAEMISWYIETNQTFPVNYINEILSFARANGLMVLWSEWKVGENVFRQVHNYTNGFEDIVTVAFQTNSGDLEPTDGFELVSNLFPHWGGSIQSWYWVTRNFGNATDMPISVLVQHALEACNLGAEILQFEPYWYFFNNGEPNENLEILMATLT